MYQQPREQSGVGARLQSQEQVGVFSGVGPARIDHHDPRAARLLVGEHALEQDRMAPRRVGADQHQEVGLVEILVTSGHGIGAECTTMTGNRRRHAEPRIGIDIGAADEPFHQLVGDVIILGQQLSREIERHRAGAVALDDMGKAMRDMVERVAPGHPLHGTLAAADHRMKQPVLKPKRFAQRRAFRAQPAEIGGMFAIARDRRAAEAVGRGQHPAADAAIGTGGARGAQRGIDGCHFNNRIICYAAFGGIASERPNIMSLRMPAIGPPLRISSRYQSASAVSPTSTAPVRRPPEITSFL